MFSQIAAIGLLGAYKSQEINNFQILVINDAAFNHLLRQLQFEPYLDYGTYM